MYNYGMPQKTLILWQNCNYGSKHSYMAMYDIVEHAKDGTIFIPDDFTTCGTPDAVRSGLSRLCRNGKLCRFAKGIIK